MKNYKRPFKIVYVIDVLNFDKPSIDITGSFLTKQPNIEIGIILTCFVAYISINSLYSVSNRRPFFNCIG